MSKRVRIRIAAYGGLALLIVLLLGQCVSIKNPDVTLEQTADGAMAARLRADVEKVVNGFGWRNSDHGDHLDRLAGYLAAQLKASGCEVSFQEVPVDGRVFRNVIGVVPGKTAKRIIIGAHYDACEELPGADDNASAVAGLLELARLMGRTRHEHTIEFVMYCNEEPPYFATEHMGSAHHARLLERRGDEVAAMICLEMLGYYSDEPDSQKYPMRLMKAMLPSTGNFIGVVGNGQSVSLAKLIQREMNKASSLPVARANIAQSIGFSLDFSDHRNYWDKGYAAVMITDTAYYRNPNYHQPTDTPDTLDYRRMSDVVKALHRAVTALDKSSKTAGG